MIYYFAWHYQLLKVPNISEVISSHQESLLTIKLKSPDESKIQPIIKSIDYLYKLNKSVTDFEAKVDTQFSDLGIVRSKRILASSNQNSYEKIMEQINRFKGKRKFEFTLGIGIKDGGLQKIEFSSAFIQKFLTESLKGMLAIKLDKPISSSSLMALFSVNPNDLINEAIANMSLDAEVVKKVNQFKSQMTIQKNYSFGIPVFKITFAQEPSRETYLTLIAREYLVLASEESTFNHLINELQKGPANASPQEEGEILWVRLNLEKVIQSLPDNLRVFLPASTRSLKSMTINSSLSERVRFGVAVDFKDEASCKEAMIQLKMFSSMVEARKPKDEKLKEAANNWINKYYSMTQQGVSIVSKVDFPLSEPQGQLENILRAEYKQLSQDFSLLNAVTQYMKSNNLVQIKLKDLNRPAALVSQNLSQQPFLVYSEAVLSGNNNGQLVRPLMLVTQANCTEDSKFDFQLRNKEKLTSVLMYKIYQDPKGSLSSFSFDSKTTGLHVLMLSTLDYSKDWELVFHTPVDSKLMTYNLPTIKDRFTGAEATKTMVRLKSNSSCQIPFEPFILAQVK